MRQIIRIGSRALAVVVPLALLACESDNAIGPGNTLVVLNIQDQFSFSIMALDNVTDSERHIWVNSGTTASINITQAITQGTATLQIRDGAGTILYSDNIADDIDTTTSVGVTGLWQIDVVMTKVTGEFSFTVDRARRKLPAQPCLSLAASL